DIGNRFEVLIETEIREVKTEHLAECVIDQEMDQPSDHHEERPVRVALIWIARCLSEGATSSVGAAKTQCQQRWAARRLPENRLESGLAGVMFPSVPVVAKTVIFIFGVAFI